MALIKFGALITDFSGKVGGTIFSKNRGGSYAKNRVVPNNPATARQSIVRGRFGSLSSQWRALEQSERDSFSNTAGNFPKTNRIGDTIQLAGNALFVSLNAALLAVNRPIITIAPTPVGVTEYNPTGFSATDGGVNTSLTVTAVPIDSALQSSMRIQIFATAPVSAGISNLNSKFRQIGFSDTDGLVAGLDIGDQYTAIFGPPILGARIGVRLVPVNINTGEQGVGTERLTIVVAIV